MDHMINRAAKLDAKLPSHAAEQQILRPQASAELTSYALTPLLEAKGLDLIMEGAAT